MHNVRRGIMGNVKVKFEKYHNRKHLLQAAGAIHEFIQAGDEAAVKNKVTLAWWNYVALP